MLSLLGIGALFMVAMVVLGSLALLAGLIGWLIALPFRILGLALKLVGFVILLPVLLIAGLFSGAGVLLALCFGLLLPLAPLVGLGWLAWWLLHDRKPGRSQASVVS